MNRKSFLFAAYVAFALAVFFVTLPYKNADAQDRDFDSDRISMVTCGTGPDIILIHGLAAHRDVWAGVAETLDDRYRLHLVQVNGFAPGANADGRVSAPVAEAIAWYIREADLDRPAVIGHSMGGSIGMMLAARHPGVVGRLMVVDATPFMGVAFGPPGTTPESVRPIADQMRETILSQPSDSTGLLDHMIVGMTRTEEMRPVLLQYARDSHRRTVANAFHELIVTDLRSELARVIAPMTVLYIIPPHLPIPSEEFESALRGASTNAPHTRFVRIENSNHYIQINQPARFVAEVDAFMQR